MAPLRISPAKAVLLAVQLASESNIAKLRKLIALQRKALRTDLILRILLSHLPESLPTSEYIPFLKDLADGTTTQKNHYFDIDASHLEDLDELDASKQVKKLRLLPLEWPNAPEDAPKEPLILFLIHRSIRIDESTGLITEIPGLITPFLDRSPYLRTWMISTILPLIRLYYEYHPSDTATISVINFGRLDDEAGLALLLSGTRKQEHTVGRDIRGLVGPWLYGDTRQKRRKLRRVSSLRGTSVQPIDEAPATNEKCQGWEVVFKWIVSQASVSWKTAVRAVEQWDGPGDVDLGGYENGTKWIDEDDQQSLERRYARSALAAAYSISMESLEALNGVHQILSRILVLLDLDKIPTLEASGALLIPIEGLDGLFSPKDVGCLRNGLLDEQNSLTQPNAVSLKFLHAALISAYLYTKESSAITVRKAADLALRQDPEDQLLEFRQFIVVCIGKVAQKADDKDWVRMRNSVLWLRSWGSEDLDDGSETGNGRGIFGKVPKQTVEVAILKGLLSNGRISLAQKIYGNPSDLLLDKQLLREAVVTSAMQAYDNATNANMTRGGVKKSNDILNAFPEELKSCVDTEQLKYLVLLTHSVGQYRLVFNYGEPFTPVLLRVHSDPISILGKILEQNLGSYTKINDFIDMGQNMLKAGLIPPPEPQEPIIDINGDLVEPETPEVIAEKRVVCMCIDAALNEDDFETAYSYVMSRLEDLAAPAQVEVKPNAPKAGSKGLFARPPPINLDQWSWKAALQAGKYHRNQHTVKPTHIGNASGNPEIRHLQQRMDCLSLALRCAPSTALQEILNAFRRCEEELQVHIRQEEEEEAAWEEQGDNTIPGGFTSSKPHNDTRSSSQVAEEAPMSLFDLSRASFARAHTGLSSLSSRPGVGPGEIGSSEATTPAQRARRRDQLAKAAAGTLASGVGWLIGAPAPKNSDEDSS